MWHICLNNNIINQPVFLHLRGNAFSFSPLRIMFAVGLSSTQFSSVAQSYLTLCDPMNCSTPGLTVHHQLPKSTQTYVHGVGDAIQPSHPLSSTSPDLNLFQHQGLSQWVSSQHQVAKVLEFQLQHQSLQWTPRTDHLYDGLVGSPWSPRDSRDSSPIPQFQSINSSALSFLYSPTLTPIHNHWKNHSMTYGLYYIEVCSSSSTFWRVLS